MTPATAAPTPATPSPFYVIEVHAIEWVYCLTKSLSKFKPTATDVQIQMDHGSTVFRIRKAFYPIEELVRILGVSAEKIAATERIILKPLGPANGPQPNVPYIGEA